MSIFTYFFIGTLIGLYIGTWILKDFKSISPLESLDYPLAGLGFIVGLFCWPIFCLMIIPIGIGKLLEKLI